MLRLISTTLCSSSVLNSPFSIVFARSIKRWIAPTILELRQRKNRFADKLPRVHKRSSFIDWNLDAEIFSFGKRLNENFDLSLLKQSFVQRSYVIQEELQLKKVGLANFDFNLMNNQNLAGKGRKLADKFIAIYLKYHLPELPDEGLFAVKNYLLSTEKLAYISSNLGTKEIIMSAEYPPSEESLCNTLLAIIGALDESRENNSERTYRFIRDIIITQLNQIDVFDIWNIDQPYKCLKNVLADKNITNIEPRIIGEVSPNYILSGCRIGIYNIANKKCLGSGYGDTYENGIETASMDALAKIFYSHNSRPFDFAVSVNELSKLEN